MHEGGPYLRDTTVYGLGRRSLCQLTADIFGGAKSSQPGITAFVLCHKGNMVFVVIIIHACTQ